MPPKRRVATPVNTTQAQQAPTTPIQQPLLAGGGTNTINTIGTPSTINSNATMKSTSTVIKYIGNLPSISLQLESKDPNQIADQLDKIKAVHSSIISSIGSASMGSFLQNAIPNDSIEKDQYNQILASIKLKLDPSISFLIPESEKERIDLLLEAVSNIITTQTNKIKQIVINAVQQFNSSPTDTFLQATTKLLRLCKFNMAYQCGVVINTIKDKFTMILETKDINNLYLKYVTMGRIKSNIDSSIENHLTEVINVISATDTTSPPTIIANLASEQAIDVNYAANRKQYHGGRGNFNRQYQGRGGGRGLDRRGGRGSPYRANQSPYKPGRGRGRGSGIGNGPASDGKGGYQFGSRCTQANEEQAKAIKEAQAKVKEGEQARQTLRDMSHIRLNVPAGRGRYESRFSGVNNKRRFYPIFHYPFTCDDDITAFTVREAKEGMAIIDGGCNKSMMISPAMIRNGKACTRVVRGFDGEAAPTVLKLEGTIAGLPAVVNEKGSVNLLAQKDIMRVGSLGMVYVQDELYMIDEDEVSQWVKRCQSKGKVIHRIQAADNGLFMMKIPETFERKKYEDEICDQLHIYNTTIESAAGETAADEIAADVIRADLKADLEDCRMREQRLQDMLSTIYDVPSRIDDLIMHVDNVIETDESRKKQIQEQLQKELDLYSQSGNYLEPDVRKRMHCIMAHRVDLSKTGYQITFLGKAEDLKVARRKRREACDCDSCMAMKSKNPPMSRGHQEDEDKLLNSEYPMHVLWIDDMMKTGDPGPFGMKHYFVIVDDYTDYCWGIASKDKSSTGQFMYEFLKFLRKWNPLDRPTIEPIRYIRTDNDGLFSSTEWSEMLTLFNIEHVPAPSHEHWLQGKVEKKIQDIRLAANTIRHHHGVPKILQIFALEFAMRAHNRTLHGNKSVTPYELLYHERPDLRFDYIPFSMVWLLTRTKDKELPRARAGVFIGYNEVSKRRRVYQCMYIADSGRIIILKSVYNPRFIEKYGFRDVYPAMAKKYQFMDENNIKNHQEIIEVTEGHSIQPMSIDDLIQNNNSLNKIVMASSPPILERSVHIISEPTTTSNTIDNDINKWLEVHDRERVKKRKQEEKEKEKFKRLIIEEEKNNNMSIRGVTAVNSPFIRALNKNKQQNSRMETGAEKNAPLIELEIDMDRGQGILTNKDDLSRDIKCLKKDIGIPAQSSELDNEATARIGINGGPLLTDGRTIAVGDKDLRITSGDNLSLKITNQRGHPMTSASSSSLSSLLRIQKEDLGHMGKSQEHLTIHTDQNNENDTNNNTKGKRKRKSKKKSNNSIQNNNNTNINHNISNSNETNYSNTGKRIRRPNVKEDYMYQMQIDDSNPRSHSKSITPLLMSAMAFIITTDSFITTVTDEKYKERVKLHIAPTSEYEIQNRSDRDKWMKAKLDELKNHIGEDISKQNRLQTFRKLKTEDEYDSNTDKLYRLVWKYVIKRDGTTFKYKARLAIDGSIEEIGVDLDTADATGSVVSAEARRVLYSYAAHHKLEYKVCDVKAAFLTANLEENRRIFMLAPVGTNEICKEIEDGEVVRVQNHFYGLKSSAKGFEQKLINALKSERMKEAGIIFKDFKYMHSIYIHRDAKTKDVIVISTYVDDIKFFFSNIILYEKVKQILEEDFILEDRTNHNFYLGNSTIKNPDGSIHIHSDILIQKMIKQFKLENTKEHETPTVGDRKYSREAMYEIKDEVKGKHNINFYKQFRSILGIVLYIALQTRPDIMFAVIRITRQQSKPKWGDYEDLLHIVGYLKRTSTLGITFTGDWLNDTNQPTLSLFTDASYADIKDGKQSSVGHILYLGRDIISYSASATKNVVRSTCESELYSLDSGVMDSINTQRFVQELTEFHSNVPTNVYCDNLAAINVVIKNKQHKGLKHTDIAIAYLREKFIEMKYRLYHIRTDENVADIFTKALFIQKFKDMRNKLFNMRYI